MYEIQSVELTMDNFFAGSFPVITDFGEISSGATIHKFAPLVQGANGIEEATDAAVDTLIGIAAEVPSGTEVIYYLTGEFFSDSLDLTSGATIAVLKPAFRKLGIFLKEMKNNG